MEISRMVKVINIRQKVKFRKTRKHPKGNVNKSSILKKTNAKEVKTRLVVKSNLPLGVAEQIKLEKERKEKNY